MKPVRLHPLSFAKPTVLKVPAQGQAVAAPAWSQEGGTLLGTHHRGAAGALLELLGPEPGCIYPASDRKSRGSRSRRLRLLGTTESFSG